MERKKLPKQPITCEVCVLEPDCSARPLASSAIGRIRFHRHFPLTALAPFVVALVATLAMSSPAVAVTAGSHPSEQAVVDYSSGFNSSTPATLRKAGVGVVIRYVGSSAWKCLTPAEATALRSSGIDIAAVYESSAGWMLGGRSAGIAAAKAARAAIIADGGPRQPFVYFACDTDTSDFASVNAALLGAQSVLGAENVGIYGSYAVCANALKAKAAAKAWQTVAWSNGSVLPGIALLQLIPQTLGNLGVDYDANVRYASDIGQWGVTVRPAGGQQSASVSASQAVSATEAVSFTPQSTQTTATLRAVESTDGVSGWAVGDGGTILHTASAGSTWTVQSTPSTATLNAVHFANGHYGWAAGENGTVIHTVSAGTTWTVQSTPTTSTLKSISFADSENGWAVGEHGTVLHTGNGGVTWTHQSVPTTATLNCVEFSSETTGMAFGENGTFLLTNDAGESWFRVSTPTTQTLSAYCAVSPTSTSGWSVGASGTVLFAGSDGATGAVQPVPTASALHGVAFADSSRGMAVGASGTVLFTRDAGQTWTAHSVATAGRLNAVKLIGTKGWVVGDGGRVFRLRLESSR